jgi:hypothetical protein
MREAYNEVKIIKDENDVFLGISLGFDFCAEHERGIRGIQSTFRIPLSLNPNNFGLKGRTIKKTNDRLLKFFKFKKVINKKTYEFAFLTLDYLMMDVSKNKIPYVFENRLGSMVPNKWEEKPKEIITAWNENGFGIVVRGCDNINLLENLYTSFGIKDICIGMLSGKLFGNSLVIIIKSRIPKEIDEVIKIQDLENYKASKLKERWKKRLSKLKKDELGLSFGLSISFFDFQNNKNALELMKTKNTKHNYLIWVNLAGNIYGWYTVEEIKSWLKNKVKSLKEFKDE